MTFYEEIAKLKNVLRKGWLIRNVGQKNKNLRIESVAEHTFSMSLLAIQLMENREVKFDEGKVLKMIAIHDLCEIDYGDHTPFDNVKPEDKFENELQCVKRLAQVYNLKNILSLWQEFEKGESEEAKFVKKVDKLDAILQSSIYQKDCEGGNIFEEFKNNQLEIYNEFFKDIK